MGFLTPNSAGERETLKTFVLQQLGQLRSTAYGLTQEQINSTPSASGLSIGQLLVHATEATGHWLNLIEGSESRPEHDMQTCAAIAAEHSVGELVAEYDQRVASFAGRIDAIRDLSDPVAVPEAPWFPLDLKSWETRWVLCHLVAELARHAGHADVIRETIDGKTAYELNARNDGELADDEEFRPFG